MYTRLPLADDKKGAKLTGKELESISDSFYESLRSRLWGLSPASVSLPWLSSAIDVVTFAHFSAKALIHELKVDSSGDNLSSCYLDNSLKVLDICSCISSETERLRLRCLNLGVAIDLLLLDGNPSEEQIRQARDSLAQSEGQGEGSYVKSAGDIEELIRDLATSMGMSAHWQKVSPAERVVRRAIHAVNFVTAFVAGLISSALRTPSGAVISVRVPKEFPWGDPVQAIEAAVITELGRGKKRDSRKMQVLKELDDMEARARHVIEVIDEVVGSGGNEEFLGRLRAAATGLETATEAMGKGLSRLRDGLDELFLTVTKTRKDMADELRSSMRKPPLPKRPSKPGTNDEETRALLLEDKIK